MHRCEDIKVTVPIPLKKRTGASATSCSIDTLGAHAVLFNFIRGSGTTANKLYFYHASASTTLTGSATAFTTLPTLSTTTASGFFAILVEGQTAMKRYFLVKQSKMSTSQLNGATCTLFFNRAIPGSSTLGSFTSITRPLV